MLVLACVILACESDPDPGDPSPTTSQTSIFNSPVSTCVIEAEGASPVCVVIDQSGRTCGPSPDFIPFYGELALPDEMPDGMTLVEACMTGALPGIPDSQIAEFIYATADGTKNIHISTARIIPVQARGREPIQLGTRTGYITNTARTDGSTLYSVELERDGRAYTVIAILGPENAATPEQLNEVALAISER